MVSVAEARRLNSPDAQARTDGVIDAREHFKSVVMGMDPSITDEQAQEMAEAYHKSVDCVGGCGGYMQPAYEQSCGSCDEFCVVCVEELDVQCFCDDRPVDDGDYHMVDGEGLAYYNERGVTNG